MAGKLLRIHASDNVAVATGEIPAGKTVRLGKMNITLREAVSLGHKVALRPIAEGEKIVKYGLPIGTATRSLEPGDWVHTHNLKSDYYPTFQKRGADGTEVSRTE